MKVNKELVQIAFQLKFWKITNQNFPNLLVTWSILLLQQVFSPLPLKWQISLLSNISKIFEKMMHIWLTSFLNKNKVLSSFQFGFWNKHSTNHVFISLTEMISTWQWSVRVWCIYQPTESIWYCRPQNSSI